MSKNETLKAYEGFKFTPKITGPRPTAVEFEKAERLGFRRGSAVTVANAMYLRANGATSNQVQAVGGIKGPQLNGMRGVVTKGLAKRISLPSRDGHTVYKLEFVKAASEAKPKAQTKRKAAPKGKGKGKAASKRKAASKAQAKPDTVAQPDAVTQTA